MLITSYPAHSVIALKKLLYRLSYSQPYFFRIASFHSKILYCILSYTLFLSAKLYRRTISAVTHSQLSKSLLPNDIYFFVMYEHCRLFGSLFLLPQLRSLFIESLKLPSTSVSVAHEVESSIDSVMKEPRCNSFITEKNVLLVGPSFDIGNLPNHQHIDLIVQINNSSLPFSRHLSNLPIIIYLNRDYLYRNSFDVSPLINPKVKALYLRPGTQISESTRFSLSKHNGIPIDFCSDLPTCLNYFQTPFYLIYILYDLLRHRPNSISLCGFDLHTSSHGIHNYNYYVNHPLHTQISSVRFHDPYYHFIVIQQLYRLSLVEPDNVLSKILELSEQEYLTRLPAHFHNHISNLGTHA